VRFAAPGGRHLAARVTVSDAMPARPFTCRSAEPDSPPAYAVRELGAG
jgi:hypothetical protein